MGEELADNLLVFGRGKVEEGRHNLDAVAGGASSGGGGVMRHEGWLLVLVRPAYSHFGCHKKTQTVRRGQVEIAVNSSPLVVPEFALKPCRHIQGGLFKQR